MATAFGNARLCTDDKAPCLSLVALPTSLPRPESQLWLAQSRAALPRRSGHFGRRLASLTLVLQAACPCTKPVPNSPRPKGKLGSWQTSPCLIFKVLCSQTTTPLNQPAENCSKLPCHSKPTSPYRFRLHLGLQRASASTILRPTMASAARRCRPTTTAGKVFLPDQPPRLAHGEAVSAARGVSPTSHSSHYDHQTLNLLSLLALALTHCLTISCSQPLISSPTVLKTTPFHASPIFRITIPRNPSSICRVRKARLGTIINKLLLPESASK